MGRNYGNPGDYDCRFVGLNGRMSELHAALALASFDDLEERIARRAILARHYRSTLGGIPGVSFPMVRADDRSTYKDLTVLIDPDAFGLSADALGEALAAEGVETRRYYSPPVHLMRAYRAVANGVDLPVTVAAAEAALALPLIPGMKEAEVDTLADAVARIRAHVGGVS